MFRNKVDLTTLLSTETGLLIWLSINFYTVSIKFPYASQLFSRLGMVLKPGNGGIFLTFFLFIKNG